MVGYRLVPPARSQNDFRHTGGAGLEAWYVANIKGQVGFTTGAPTANVLRALPFIAPARGGTLDRIGFEITTNVAGNTRIGLYENASSSETTMYPGTLLVESASIVNSLALHNVTISQTLVPGSLYWIALVGSVAPTIRGCGVSQMDHLLGVSADGVSLNMGISVAHAFGALPTTFTAGGAFITAVPIPVLRYRFSA